MLYFVVKVTVYALIIVCAIYGFSKVKENLLKQNNETFVDDHDDDINERETNEVGKAFGIAKSSSDKTKTVLETIKNKLFQLQDDVTERAKAINLLLEQFELDTLYDYEPAEVPKENKKMDDEDDNKSDENLVKKNNVVHKSKKQKKPLKTTNLVTKSKSQKQLTQPQGVMGRPVVTEWSEEDQFHNVDDNEDDDHNDDVNDNEDDDNEDDDEDGNDKIKYQREGFNTFTGVTSTVCNSCSYV